MINLPDNWIILTINPFLIIVDPAEKQGTLS